MHKVKVCRDFQGNICRYKRKRTYEQIVQDTEEHFAAIPEDSKVRPEIDADIE